MNITNPSFTQFLNFFPELELPVHLTDESLSVFSQENIVLPLPVLSKFISKYDNTEADEFTEYIPCFRFPDSENFYALIYWKAQLLNYEYHLVTFDKKGNFITGKVIGGLLTNGASIIKTVATIDEDWIVHIVSGEDNVNSPNYNPDSSKSFSMEILSTGDIIFSLNDEESII